MLVTLRAQQEILDFLAERFDLLWRDYVFKGRLPAVQQAQDVKLSRVISNTNPFVAFGIALSSTRTYDGRIVEGICKSKERNFVDDYEPLEIMCQLVLEGAQIADLPAPYFRGNEEVAFYIRRLWPVDPAEVYPGADEDSIITITLRGVELYPKGTWIKDQLECQRKE